MKRAGAFIIGVLCGALLFGGATVYASGILAEPGVQRIFVDGKEVQMEASLIEGHNYLQLRDIGKAVGFNVWWDDSTKSVRIESDRPYTGSAPNGVMPEEHSIEEINPAVLTDALTRDAYEALRSAIVTGSESEAVYMTLETREAMLEAEAAVGCWPVYDLTAKGSGMYSFIPRYPEPYDEAAAYCQPFIESLDGKSDREKVRQIVFFVCDRIEYDGSVYCSPRTALVSDEVQSGACMSYAHCFKFLCDMAGIPCIFTHSEDHQWNQVYVEGRWWYVDATGADVSDTSWRPYLQILKEESEMQGSMYIQSQPWLTEFAKELTVPGSTKK